MNWNKPVILAIFISLIVHAVFLAAAPHMVMSGMWQVVDQTRKMFRIRDVDKETADVSLFQETRPRPSSVKMTQQVSRLKGVNFKSMMLEEKPKEEMSLEIKKRDMIKEPVNEVIPDTNPLDMMKSEAERAKKEVTPDKRSLADRLLTEDLVDNTVNSDASDREMSHEPGQRSFDRFADGLGDWESASHAAYGPGEGDMSAIQAGARLGEYEDIGEHLDVRLKTYEDPVTGEKYFEILISVKEGSRLEVIPKEIIFLVDSSKSITEEKLAYIKEGLLDSIKSLNPEDRFNLVAFRGNLVKYEPYPVKVSERMLKKARPFINQMEAVGQTDVENALLEIIEEPVQFYPSYIVLITDGRPTTGVISSREIIQQITRRNNMRRPIFCFGGGRRVNRYLLDFISYQNRAWSRFAETTYDIRDDFDGFYNQLKDPLLLNVRYRMLGLSTSEMYPKYLSDFYYNRPFTLYGRFNNEDAFSMQLLGEINGMTKELIFEKALSKAEPGDESIAREWAFRKIYYLISRITMGRGDSGRLRDEIDRLSQKYNIKTPYDIEDAD
ncbi:MAG: VWA domain-containing protein [Candidatus Tantalella remota]|nr:VWA domain-containing protein [Candidatus Tantalella remota]